MSLLLKALTRLEPRPIERDDEHVDANIGLPIEEANYVPSEPLRESESLIIDAPAANLPVIDSDAAPIAEIEPPNVMSEMKTASELVLEPIDELQRLVMEEIAGSDPTVEDPPLFIDSPISASPSAAAQTPTVPLIELSVEYQELCQHLLSRFRLEKHSTLIAVDAGQVPTDASWLFPFAAGFIQMLAAIDGSASAPARILIVEAAGPTCGISQSLGIRGQIGLTEALADQTKLKDAIHSTEHPQVFLIERGNVRLGSASSDSIAELWAELLPQFDLVLMAAGPWFAQSSGHGHSSSSQSSAAALLAPIADAAILCVELNGTLPAVAAATKRQLDACGVNVLGCVVRGDSATE